MPDSPHNYYYDCVPNCFMGSFVRNKIQITALWYLNIAHQYLNPLLGLFLI